MCAIKEDRAVTFTCYFQLDMISLQPIKSVVTECDDTKYYNQSILSLHEQECKEQSCAELPAKH